MDFQTILALIVLAIVVIFAIYKIITDKKDTQQVLLGLVIEAERIWDDKSGQGELKRNYVLGQVQSWMPIFIRPFFPIRVLDVMIDEALEYLRKKLEDEDDIERI